MDAEHTIVSPDEAKAEQEALTEAKADEVRAKVVADLGLTDDETNKAVIDKVVERELDHRKKLSGAIKQKIDWREKAKGSKPTPPAPTGDKPLDAEAVRKQAEDAVTARLEQRDLDEMDYPDEIKAEIKKLAQVRGVSVRAAAKDGYITHLVSEAVAAGRIKEAAVPAAQQSRTVKTDKVPHFDMSAAEGRQQFKEWQQSKKQG